MNSSARSEVRLLSEERKEISEKDHQQEEPLSQSSSTLPPIMSLMQTHKAAAFSTFNDIDAAVDEINDSQEQ